MDAPQPVLLVPWLFVLISLPYHQVSGLVRIFLIFRYKSPSTHRHLQDRALLLCLLLSTLSLCSLHTRSILFPTVTKMFSQSTGSAQYWAGSNIPVPREHRSIVSMSSQAPNVCLSVIAGILW